MLGFLKENQLRSTHLDRSVIIIIYESRDFMKTEKRISSSEKLILYFLRVLTLNLKIATVAVIHMRLAVWKRSIIAHSHKDTINHPRPPTTPSICFHSQRLCEQLHPVHCVHTNTHTHAEKYASDGTGY